MQVKKGVLNRYATLLARDVLHVQTAHLKTRFELAPASTMAENVAQFTNQAMRDWEQAQGKGRLRPGELLLHRNGQPLVLPLLASEALRQLARGVTPGPCAGTGDAAVPEPETDRGQSGRPLQTLRQAELALGRSRREDFLPESPLNANRLEAACHNFLTGEFPAKVLKPVVETLVGKWGLRPAGLAAQIYARCCPRLAAKSKG